MDARYEQFNELSFEAYIKSAIDKSVLKARIRKAARQEKEQPISTPGGCDSQCACRRRSRLHPGRDGLRSV